LYNILVPLLAVAVLARPVKSAPQAWVIGIGCGLGALAYPLFLLVAGCCFLRGLIDTDADVSSRPIARAAIVVLLAIAPSAGWVLFVLWYVGSFFSDTIHYRQVIWPIDSFAAGTLLGDLTEKFAYMMSGAGHQMSGPMLVFAPVVATFWLKDRRPFMSDADFELCISALAVFVLVLIFNLIVGMNTSRTAYGMVAPLLVVCGVLARIALD
jgi:hypothetical protein